MMKSDSWTDRSRFESDPARLEQIMRCPATTITPIHIYLEQLEAASDEDFSALRDLARNALVYQIADEHLAVRRAIAEFFSDRAMARWTDSFADSVAAGLDRLLSAARPDLMEDFVTPLFLRMITRMVGFRDDGSGQLFPMIAQIQRMTETMLSLRDLRAMNAAVLSLLEMLPALHEAPVGDPECLLAYLHRKRDQAPEGADLRHTALGLVVAASTMAQTLGFILYGMLMGDAGTWTDAATPGWADRQLDRMLSLYPSTLTMVRTAADDATIDGCPVAKGQTTVLDLPAANARLRAAAAGEPAKAQRSLSFGAGAHKCPGELLSRRMIARAIPALARRFPRLALHKEQVRLRATPMVQAPIALPCELHGQSCRASSRLMEIKDLETARGIVADDDDFSPPAMEAHLRALAEGSGRDLAPAIRIARNAMFFMSGERHAAARRAVAGCLGGNRLPIWQDLINSQVSRTLDGLAMAEAPDLIHDFADPLFRGITHPILGIETGDPAHFDTLAPILQGVLEPWLPMRELLRLQEVFAELLALIRLPEAPDMRPGSSLLSSLLASDLPDFETEDVKALVLVLYGASFNLSHTLGNVLHWILIQPPEERCDVGDPRWMSDNMERLISLCASPKYIYRMARHPTQAGGLPFHGRDTARLQLLSINRGVAAGHLAFGHGLHHCVGAGLSRMMLRSAVPALFQRFPSISLKPQAHVFFEMSQTVAMAKLPCLLHPGKNDQ